MKAILDMKYLRVTQGYQKGNHIGGYPIDIAGEDTGIDSIGAPFDGVIKKIYRLGNTVWIESLNKVEYADGTKDYAVVSLTHDNNVANLYVGKKLKRGQTFYQEGKNNASANHIHLECGRGKFTGMGWYKTNGKWRINNPVKPENMLFLPESTKILNGGGYKWKREVVMSPQDKKDLVLGRRARKGKWEKQVNYAKQLAEKIAETNQTESWLKKLIKKASKKR